MRIMVDTNILVSAILNHNSIAAQALSKAVREHSLVICSYVIEELSDVFMRKFPDKLGKLDAFLLNLDYELCETHSVSSDTPDMRDEDDRPILQSAIDTEADVILTGDDDFHALEVESPIIISPGDLLRGLA